MKRLISIILLSVMLSGCSLVPRITFDSKGTTPETTEKSLRKISCKGEIILNADGTINSCTKGFKEYDRNYEKKERVYTIKEKITNFFRALSGYSFWIIVALIFLCPSLLGLIVGRIFNGANVLSNQLIRSIRKFRQKSNAKEELDDILRVETDDKTKKMIATKRVTLN